MTVTSFSGYTRHSLTSAYCDIVFSVTDLAAFLPNTVGLFYLDGRKSNTTTFNILKEINYPEYWLKVRGLKKLIIV